MIASAIANDYAKAKTLIDLGASPYLRYEGKTPLDFVLENPEGDPRLVELFRAAMK